MLLSLFGSPSPTGAPMNATAANSVFNVIANSVSQSALTGGIFPALITALVGIYNYPEIDPTLRVTDIPLGGIQEAYDFVIVGGGTAGCIVANRLTEIANWQILLIEAGADETAFTDVPLSTYQLWGTILDWNYTTVPQENACRILENSTCLWPRGRVLGGSSVINDFVAIRGNRLDYDKWAALGNTGWSYDDVLPFFIRMENQGYPPYAADRTYHGVGGYMSIQRPTYRTVLSDAFVRGGQQLGYQEVDCNAAQQVGFMVAEANVANGTRCSTGKCYLRPARSRPNLSVSLNSIVNKVIVNNGRAVGVQFQRDGMTINVTARKEVIICAGTANSPQVLMRSGIGPRSVISKLDIPFVLDLPVGRHLQDHIGIPVPFTVTPGIPITPSQFYTVDAALQYARTLTGPLTSAVGIEGVAFMLAPNSTTPEIPDTETIYTTYVPGNTANVPLCVGLTYAVHPVARGYITINSTDPNARPIIDPMYLTDERDIQMTITAMKNVLAVLQTPALQQFNASYFPGLFTGCLEYPLLSEAYFRCVVANYTTTIYHPVGTCSMGPIGSPNAVVDPRLRIQGLQGIRVIDGSIIPLLPSGNVNLPIMMIAEKASDMIRQDYNVSRTVLNSGGS